MIALNPLVHPKKEVSVFSVYVIISLFIFKIPYFDGQPSLDTTLIEVSFSPTLVVNVVSDSIFSSRYESVFL